MVFTATPCAGQNILEFTFDTRVSVLEGGGAGCGIVGLSVHTWMPMSGICNMRGFTISYLPYRFNARY